MLGVIYLIISEMIGYETTKVLLESRESQTVGNRIWLILPSSFGVGTLILTWAVYIISWFASVKGRSDTPLFWGNLCTLTASAAILTVLLIRKKGEKEASDKIHVVSDRKNFIKELIFFGMLFFFLTYIMFYVFYEKDGVLYSGVTVYGDYAPHTAMMRSFSKGNNFPTQYPHYGGADVKYHFMFQFLAGNLEYLGMRLDIAYNLISIFSLLGFLMLLYQLAKRITGKMCCGILACFFFFFRSGMAFFRFAWEHIQAGDFWNVLKENSSFIGYTANEDWGLFSFNVYLNQRHLALGMLLVTLAIWVFMDWLDAGISHEEKGWVWFGRRLFSKEAWISRNLERSLMVGLMLGLCAFWNGAAVIGGLLILCGFAVFSDGKLDYLIMAGITVLLSFLQTKIFIRGSAMSPRIYLGFLAEDKSPWGVICYLFWMSGIFFLGLIVPAVCMKRKGRTLLFAFLLPAISAFILLMTPDINVNHKYIMISYAFLAIIWAWAICRLWDGKFFPRILAVILIISLTATGMYDFAVILKGNGPGRRVSVDMNSDLTVWLEDHLGKNDLLLTPEYSMNEVTMSGVMLYYGWPYYAWSAGYDTNYRADRAVDAYTASDPETLKNVISQEKITYILFEDGMEFEQHKCREDVIAETYKRVYISQDGRIRIYKTGVNEF